MRKLFLLLAFIIIALSGNAKQWLVFSASDINLATKSYAGHAFITFIKEDPTAKQTVEVGTWGFYPGDGGGYFGKVPGVIRDDLKRTKSASFMVAVNDEEFKNSLRIKDIWNTRRYRLTGINCVNFLKETASAIPKLVVPGMFTQLPMSFVNNLKEDNLAHNVVNVSMEFQNSQESFSTKPLNLSPSPLATALFSPRDEFNNYSQIELSKTDMNIIAENSGLRYDPVSKAFANKDDPTLTYPFQVFVKMIDFNKDGSPEVYINCYNDQYHGRRSEETVFIKKKGGGYEIALKERGGARLLTTGNLGYPDILIVGPGMTAPGYRWNGVKYVFYKTYPFGAGDAPESIRFNAVK